MYYIYGISGPSLLIESTDSMINTVLYITDFAGSFCDDQLQCEKDLHKHDEKEDLDHWKGSICVMSTCI